MNNLTLCGLQQLARNGLGLLGCGRHLVGCAVNTDNQAAQRREDDEVREAIDLAVVGAGAQAFGVLIIRMS